MPTRTPVSVTLDRMAEVAGAIRKLSTTRLYVGIPSETAQRSDGPINNAAIGYIQSYGAPEVNIPARPFLHPTVTAKQNDLIRPALQQVGVAAFEGKDIEVPLARLGQKVADAVRETIIEGIPPPLKAGTVLGRIRGKSKYKNASKKQKALMRADAMWTGATPLINTGELLKSITYVIRKG